MLPVTSFASYLTDTFVQWRDDDHNASKLVKAVKRKPFRGYAKARFEQPDGSVVTRQVTTSNPEVADDWWSQRCAKFLTDMGMNREHTFALVPFPSRDCIYGQKRPEKYAAHRLAHDLAFELGVDVTVMDIIRWTERRESASDEGGTRNPYEIHPYLKLLPTKQEPDFIILVDDVVTSGARLRAAAALLSSDEAQTSEWPIWKAVTVGRTVNVRPDDPFLPHTRVLDPFDPTEPPF